MVSQNENAHMKDLLQIHISFIRPPSTASTTTPAFGLVLVWFGLVLRSFNEPPPPRTTVIQFYYGLLCISSWKRMRLKRNSKMDLVSSLVYLGSTL